VCVCVCMCVWACWVVLWSPTLRLLADMQADELRVCIVLLYEAVVGQEAVNGGWSLCCSETEVQELIFSRIQQVFGGYSSN